MKNHGSASATTWVTRCAETDALLLTMPGRGTLVKVSNSAWPGNKD